MGGLGANGVRWDIDGRVLRIVLDRAEAGNAVDPAMSAGLTAAVDRIDERIGCVLLLAEGRNFCVGGDIRGFAAADRPGEHIGALATAFHEVQRAMAGADVPVVAGVQGWAAGAGMSLALCADVLVLGRSARMRAAYTGIGVSPDGGMSWTLPRAVGTARALDLILTNRPLDAEEALAAGLASRVVDDEQVRQVAEELAAGLADGPTGALGAAKWLVRTAMGIRDDGFAEHLDREARTIARCAGSPEGREGIAAFVGKREPRYHRAEEESDEDPR